MIEKPSWEELRLGNFLVVDGITTIISYKPECPDIGRMDLQVVGNSRDKTNRHYISISKEDYEDYRDVVIQYSKDNYWMRYGELLPLTEEDKKPWYMK